MTSGERRRLPNLFDYPSLEGDDNPAYPALNAGVARFRRKAVEAGGVMMMKKPERQAYGEAVLTAVRANHRAALRREVPERTVNCASGTNHNTGEAILAAIRRKQGIR
jgi:hypothetical protein